MENLSASSAFSGGAWPDAVPGSDEFAELCKSLDGRSRLHRFVKRSFDIVFSACVCVLCFVPCAFLSLLIAIDTKGAPIYSQVRVGKHGRPFRIYKFRSMVADSDNVRKYFTEEQLRSWERERKVDDDPRVTKLGRVLRKTSIDELPQFINVLMGQISVIGPRAITYDELSHFGSDAPLLLSCEPGITGSWQCGPRNSATFSNGERQRIELEYASESSIETDRKVFLKTFDVMFSRRTGR